MRGAYEKQEREAIRFSFLFSLPDEKTSNRVAVNTAEYILLNISRFADRYFLPGIFTGILFIVSHRVNI